MTYRRSLYAAGLVVAVSISGCTHSSKPVLGDPSTEANRTVATTPANSSSPNRSKLNAAEALALVRRAVANAESARTVRFETTLVEHNSAGELTASAHATGVSSFDLPITAAYTSSGRADGESGDRRVILTPSSIAISPPPVGKKNPLRAKMKTWLTSGIEDPRAEFPDDGRRDVRRTVAYIALATRNFHPSFLVKAMSVASAAEQTSETSIGGDPVRMLTVTVPLSAIQSAYGGRLVQINGKPPLGPPLFGVAPFKSLTLQAFVDGKDSVRRLSLRLAIERGHYEVTMDMPDYGAKLDVPLPPVSESRDLRTLVANAAQVSSC